MGSIAVQLEEFSLANGLENLPGKFYKAISPDLIMAKKIKRLYRAAEKDSMIGGVCAGIAEYFEADPTLVRLAWVVLTILTWGTGLVGYLIMWIIMPRRN